MRPDPAELGLFTGKAHDVVDGLTSELGLALGNEEPGELVLPCCVSANLILAKIQRSERGHDRRGGALD